MTPAIKFDIILKEDMLNMGKGALMTMGYGYFIEMM